PEGIVQFYKESGLDAEDIQLFKCECCRQESKLVFAIDYVRMILLSRYLIPHVEIGQGIPSEDVPETPESSEIRSTMTQSSATEKCCSIKIAEYSIVRIETLWSNKYYCGGFLIFDCETIMQTSNYFADIQDVSREDLRKHHSFLIFFIKKFTFVYIPLFPFGSQITSRRIADDFPYILYYIHSFILVIINNLMRFFLKIIVLIKLIAASTSALCEYKLSKDNGVRQNEHFAYSVFS
ncbi:hypothetical protein ALC53_12612, partial [Atta colombica]